MYKIKQVEFENHPILGNLHLDFCDRKGNPVDTVIFAGENGTGKSTILNALYEFFTGTMTTNATFTLLEDDKEIKIVIYPVKYNERLLWHSKDQDGRELLMASEDWRHRYPFHAIFSDVDINFNPSKISNVTSNVLDNDDKSRRSDEKMPTKIKQLLIDIQDLDDNEIGNCYRKIKAEHGDLNEIHPNERMPRFKRAFDRMFEELKYDRVENQNNEKQVIFKKFGKDVSIDNLSSGEKQIVYRGCFLLKDVNALTGAFVFIDEPEISLHPKWQMKILDYYRNIFTDESGNQTSQLFVVTHSPFVIQNPSRHDDKVIVLTRDEQGSICVQDKPSYYICNGVEAIQDAFHIDDFNIETSNVFVEGRTDEKYFNATIKAFDLKVPFEFHWIGHIDEKNHQETFTGCNSLSNAYSFLLGRGVKTPQIFLYDSDTKTDEIVNGYLLKRRVNLYENSKGISRGIENALVLDNVEIAPFTEEKEQPNEYGTTNTIRSLKKMELCDYICGLDVDKQKHILYNLKKEIDRLRADYEKVIDG